VVKSCLVGSFTLGDGKPEDASDGVPGVLLLRGDSEALEYQRVNSVGRKVAKRRHDRGVEAVAAFSFGRPSE
jgi:hypothetical protein